MARVQVIRQETNRRGNSKLTIRFPSIDDVDIRNPRQARKIVAIMKKDILDFASDTAVEQVREQAKGVKAFPSAMVLDRSTVVQLTPQLGKSIAKIDTNTQTISGFKRSLAFRYADFGALADAVETAWVELMSLMQMDSGAARRSCYLWGSAPNQPGKRFTNPSGARVWLTKASDPMTKVSILGPTVEYRRDVIYNPRGAKSQTQRVAPSKAYNKGFARDRYKYHESQGRVRIRTNTKTGRQNFRVQVTRAIGMMVRNKIRREFKSGIYTSYRFVPSKELPLPIMGHRNSKWKPDGPNKHIPVLALGLRHRGKFNIKTT